MYSSAFYKMEARSRLKGNYAPALTGTLIYLIPTYLLYLIDYLLGFIFMSSPISAIIAVILNIFVLNIFEVGYFRFLLNIRSADDTETDIRAKRFDFNDILSGYTRSFKNTLKTMFMRDLYLFLWGLIAFIPALVLIGIIAYMAIATDIISQLYSMLIQLIDSPTPDMINNISAYIAENCPYLSVLSFAALIATAACVIPVVYKTYEYAVIPMILGETPEMDTKNVFKRSFNIMHGFRLKYFFIQLSFLLYMILASIIFIVSHSALVYYIAQAFLIPYMYMTFLMFYTKRRDIINYNIFVYGEN